ncbi:hypothetical protein ACFOWM_09030 [Ferruginibacter yonginensis]|uniref:Uncharacterized protein n=1 Tax=Ferruginibacter yonginensis TaxID=1310416 RepID=A0ABV8QSF6_9BACT
MTKEEILRSYLEDDLFIEQKYLAVGEAGKYKWATHSDNNLIQVLKLAIEGEVSNESANVTEKKINTLLNRQQ